MTEENSTNAQSAQPESNTSETRVVPDGYVSLTERDKSAAAARRDGSTEGYSKAQSELLSKLGAESLEDAQSKLKAAKDREDAEKSAQDRLADTQSERDSFKGERDSYKETAERYEKALQGYLEKEREGIREEILPLLDNMDPVAQLAYISEHGEKLRSETPEEPSKRRAPDANVRQGVDTNVRGRARLAQAFSSRT